MAVGMIGCPDTPGAPPGAAPAACGALMPMLARTFCRWAHSWLRWFTNSS